MKRTITGLKNVRAGKNCNTIMNTKIIGGNRDESSLLIFNDIRLQIGNAADADNR